MNEVAVIEREKEVIPYSEIERMGRAIAQSKLFGMQTPEQAIALMLIAQAEGLHPAIAARDYHIIQGRPALKSDAMLARFQQAGGKVQWKEISDTRVSAVFTHPAGGSVEMEWTMDRAKQAGIVNKDNWQKYPRQMLRARVISEGIRTVFPGSVVGIYTPEEVQDMEPIKVEPLAITTEAPQGKHEPVREPVEQPKPKEKKVLSKRGKYFWAQLCKAYTTESGEPDKAVIKEAIVELTGKPSLFECTDDEIDMGIQRLQEAVGEDAD